MVQGACLLFADFVTDARYQVAVHREPRQGDIDAHAHTFVELAFVTGGRAHHRTEGVQHQVCEGDVLIIHGNRTHEYRDTQSFSVVNVLVREGAIRDAGPLLAGNPAYHALFGLRPIQAQSGRYTNRVHMDAHQLEQALAHITAIEKAQENKGPTAPLRSSAWLQLLLSLVLDAYHGSDEDTPHPDSGLAAAIAHVEQAPLEPLRLEDLTRLARTSERTLLRRFKQATGHSPIAFQLRCRIHRAQRLLLETSHPVGEVSALCGFEDSNYFARQFRRISGTSPRAWRKRSGDAGLQRPS